MEGEANPAAGQDNTATAPEAQPAVQAPANPPAPEPAPAPAAATEPAPDKPAEFTSMLADQSAQQAQESGQEDEPAESEVDPPEESAFEVKLPDGFVADPKAVDFLKGMVKDGAMSAEAAQKAADEYTASIRRFDEYRMAEGHKQIQAWEDEISNHPEFGGVKLEENLENARLMLQKYGSPRLAKEFQRMGVLSHPEFAYMLMRIHRDVSEGVTIGGAGQAMPEKDAATIMFGDDVK